MQMAVESRHVYACQKNDLLRDKVIPVLIVQRKTTLSGLHIACVPRLHQWTGNGNSAALTAPQSRYRIPVL